MPWDIILGAIGGSSISIIVVVVLFLIFAQRMIEKSVDTGARHFESRILQAEKAYGKLWHTTSILPKWPRAEKVTYKQLMDFSKTLRDWYFLEGGMFLSGDARDAYGKLQDAIWIILPHKLDGILKEEHYDAIRKKCSALRTD